MNSINSPLDIVLHAVAAAAIVIVAAVIPAPFLTLVGAVAFYVREVAQQEVRNLKFWQWTIQKQAETYVPIAILLIAAVASTLFR